MFWGLDRYYVFWGLDRRLRGGTVGDRCPEIALISCVVVAEGILSPFSFGYSLFILSNVSLSFCQLFLFSFHWIFLFSFRRRLCALSFTTHFWSRAHILMWAPRGTLGCYLFLTSDLHFLHAQSVILLLRSRLIYCVRKVKSKIPVSFTPNPLNHNCLLHPCEWWRRKTKNSRRARMRVGLGQRFFTGKQIALVRWVICSTNLRSASITATRTLFLRGAMRYQSPWFIFCALLTRNVRLHSVFG